MKVRQIVQKPVITASDIDAMRADSVASNVVQLSGYGYYPLYEFQEAFEQIGADRLFALYVLAKALDDIESLDAYAPPDMSSAKLTTFFIQQDKLREKRIEKLRAVEEKHRREGRELLAEYRRALRESGGSASAMKQTRRGVHSGRHREGTKSKFEKGSLRYKYDLRLQSFKARMEEENPHEAALNWFTDDQGMVAFWCHLADVGVERCYAAVERRLELIGRGSPKIHAMLKEMRKAKAEPLPMDLSWREAVTFAKRPVKNTKAYAIETLWGGRYNI